MEYEYPEIKDGKMPEVECKGKAQKHESSAASETHN